MATIVEVDVLHLLDSILGGLGVRLPGAITALPVPLQYGNSSGNYGSTSNTLIRFPIDIPHWRRHPVLTALRFRTVHPFRSTVGEHLPDFVSQGEDTREDHRRARQ